MKVLVWYIAGALLAIAGLLDLLGNSLLPRYPVEGYIVIAVGMGLKVATIYLVEKGVIAKVKGR